MTEGPAAGSSAAEAPAAEAVARAIHREGPIPFDRFVEIALYDPEGGFFATGHGAGRTGRDFVTSPEVGSLFGACVARALDGCWHQLGAPDPLVVIEAGAGTGRLARDVLRAQPECSRALRYVLVERSAALREAQREQLDLEPADEALGPFALGSRDESPAPVEGAGPLATALDELPALELTGVVFANELLDNLPFGIAHWDGTRWQEVRVGIAGDQLDEVLVPAEAVDAGALGAVTEGAAVPAGARLPIPRGVDAWLAACGRMLHHGTVILVDYVDGVSGVLERGIGSWLRTYRAHARGAPPLTAPGTQDVTADVVREQLVAAARAAGFTVAGECSQSEWLRELGIDTLVEDGRQVWEARAHLGDLEALAGRSRAVEARALTDPEGLGAHRVVTLSR